MIRLIRAHAQSATRACELVGGVRCVIVAIEIIRRLSTAPIQRQLFSPAKGGRRLRNFIGDRIAELNPSGVLEDNIVADMARLVWRKQNLGTLRIAERAQKSWSDTLTSIRERYLNLRFMCKSKDKIQSKQNKKEKKYELQRTSPERAGRHLRVDRNWRRRHVRWLNKRIGDQRSFGRSHR